MSLLPIWHCYFLELTSQRPLFEICDGVIVCLLLCYTHSLFVAANPVLCYFLSMLCGVCCRVLTSSILSYLNLAVFQATVYIAFKKLYCLRSAAPLNLCMASLACLFVRNSCVRSGMEGS
jgi:hypothetical protein